MNKLRALLLALALPFSPSLASAQTVIYAQWAPPPVVVVQAPADYAPLDGYTAPLPAPAAADASRFRFGVAANLTVGLANDRGHGVDTGVFAPGLTLDLGVQVNRTTAVFLRGSAATLIVLNQASAFGVVEYSPADWLSVGTGMGWAGMASPLRDDQSCCRGASSRNHWGAIAVPAIVGFNLGRRDESSGRLRGMRIGLEGALGLEPGSGALGWHAAVSFGYVTM